MSLSRDIDKRDNNFSEMLEDQIKEFSIKKENFSSKSELSRLFYNMFVMYFDIYLDGYFFKKLRKSNGTWYLVATLGNIVNKLI